MYSRKRLFKFSNDDDESAIEQDQSVSRRPQESGSIQKFDVYT